MKKFNFVHLFLCNSSGYNKETQLFIEKLNTSYSHLFVYRYPENAPKDGIHSNTICDSNISTISGLKKYFDIGDFIFIHSLSYSRKEILQLSDSECRKIIWCVWGHDLYEVDAPHSKLFLIARDIFRLLKRRELEKKRVAEKIKNFSGIMVGFSGDIKTIRDKYGSEIPIYQAGYPGGFWAEDLKQWYIPQDEHKRVRILLGHSAYHFLKHEYYLRKLSKYKNEIELYIPLSYGNKDYAKNVERLAYDIYPKENLKIFKDIMTPKEYFQILCQIDVAIFDFEHQSAVGNILLLLFLRKLIFLSSSGILYYGFKNERLDVFDVNELNTMNIRDVFQHNVRDHNKVFVENILNHENLKHKWVEMFNDIMREKGC